MDGDKYTTGILTQLGQRILKSIHATGTAKMEVVLFLALYFGLLLLVITTEPPKLIFRKNIGRKALGIAGIIMSSIGLVIFSAISFSLGYENEREVMFFHDNTILYAGGVFYLFLAIFLIIRGVKEYNNERMKGSAYRGDSVFFHSSLNKESEVRKIWAIWEPLALLIIAMIVAIASPFVAIPLAIMSVSFWLNELYFIIIKPAQQQNLINTMQQQAVSTPKPQNTGGNFHKVSDN